MKKIRDLITIITFAIIILGFSVMLAANGGKQVSKAERRKLARFPSFTAENVFSGEAFEGLEKYALDHFAGREIFRRINSSVRTDLLFQKDVNGLWIENGSIYKRSDKMDPVQVEYGADIINKVSEKYLGGANVYYSVIPDKNYFLDDSRSSFDYEGMLNILKNKVAGAKYIDIFPTLAADDYYKTDTHWTQEKIYDTAKKIAQDMNIADAVLPEGEYTVNALSPFYGVYYGQAALSAEPDTLYYLTSKDTQNAKVYGIDPNILSSVFGVESTLSPVIYDSDKFEGMDGYDVFLSGAQPIITIEYENARTDRSLVIFRDSFASSLAPLFSGAYSKITLVDLRYIPSALIGDYVDFDEGADALFLFSSALLNSSMLMK